MFKYEWLRNQMPDLPVELFDYQVRDVYWPSYGLLDQLLVPEGT